MIDPHESSTKILVVDDERLIRLTLSAKLKSVGYTPVAVASVDEAAAILKAQHGSFRAVITDIMMGTMDGFIFRDIVRGFDPTMPIFFMTALDPEEGSGFLKRIMADANSYYLPKSADTKVVLRRIQSVAASRRIEQFIARQMDEQKTSLMLAAHVQHSMLPARVVMTPRGFYTTLWKPKDMVSGDLYEAVAFGEATYLYVLGDIQGHGTSAALAMTAVQSFLKQFTRFDGHFSFGPEDVANRLQEFFCQHLADVTYMTALICIHRPLQGNVAWISCGAPDLTVVDPMKPSREPINPEKRGGLPIGMMADTVYTGDDVVVTPLSDTAVCVAFSDGIYDLALDEENRDTIPSSMVDSLRDELIKDAQQDGSIVIVPQKFIAACEGSGYTHYSDDVTMLVFGAYHRIDGIYEQTVPLKLDAIEQAAIALGEWCVAQGWSDSLVNRVQLVMEESLMNVHDHGVEAHEQLNSVVSLRLRRMGDFAELTVWDCGTPAPSIAVAAGNTDTAFELKNREFSGRGRGRLIARELCKGISRIRIDNVNQTIYHIPFEMERTEEEKMT